MRVVVEVENCPHGENIKEPIRCKHCKHLLTQKNIHQKKEHGVEYEWSGKFLKKKHVSPSTSMSALASPF